MATQLSLYNGALRIVKERKLASLAEDRQSRRLLDDAWDDGQTGGAVKYCLERGQWTFARRALMIDYAPSVEPSFGYRYGFDHPSDMVKVCAICSDEYMATPVLQYVDEGDYWYCDLQRIYVSYVSNGLKYGLNMGRWPETFVNLVESQLAREIAPSLTASDSAIKMADYAFQQAIKEASSSDAMRQPTRFAPEGSWNGARRGGGVANRAMWNAN